MRFIPTRVGNTYTQGIYQYHTAVHPHACGEYQHASEAVAMQVGSSPRVWGIPANGALHLAFLRFIPTRVGNTH